MIDCSQMRAVTIDPAARTAHVQGGATIGDLIGASREHGLATTTGTISSVGMAGLTLGGGYGPLMGTYGLVADTLLSAQVVTAEGQLVTANATEHVDLFWGCHRECCVKEAVGVSTFFPPNIPATDSLR